jgi:hypothetical protein
VCFSPAQKEIHFFLPSLRCFIFFRHPKQIKRQLDKGIENPYRLRADNHGGNKASLQHAFGIKQGFLDKYKFSFQIKLSAGLAVLRTKIPRECQAQKLSYRLSNIFQKEFVL